MTIVFYCQSCSSRFDLDARLAGKQGKCKKCGERMTVPSAPVAMRAASSQRAAAVPAGARSGDSPSWVSEIEASNVALAPLTIDRMPLLKKPTMFAEDDLADSSPYLLAQPERRGGRSAVAPTSPIKMAWRRQLNTIARVFRSINQGAYLVSVPFLMLTLLGILVHNHPLADFGAAAAVLINVARLISGSINVGVIIVRDGVSFDKLKKPLRRVIEPAATIGLVALAFAFIPWLSKDAVSDQTLTGRVRTGAEKIQRKLEDAGEKAGKKAKSLGITPGGKEPEI